VTHARDGSLILSDFRAPALAIVSQTHDRRGRFPVERLGQGGFAHQMLSSMMYALMGDVVETTDVATATGIAGMSGYLGGALFTLTVGALASTIGYEPLFALLFLFDVVASLVLWIAIGARKSAAIAQPA